MQPGPALNPIIWGWAPRDCRGSPAAGRKDPVGKVLAGITISVDGFITGPGCPGRGLGVGGERLYCWVSGGPWSYDSPGHRPAAIVRAPPGPPRCLRNCLRRPRALLIGRVTIGAEASVWYGAALRADRDTIVVGARSNVQYGCVLHADPGVPLPAGSEVTIGHNATLHGCTVEDLVLIGMGAIVLNGARVGRHSIIAAGTVLTEGQQVPEGVLMAGVPGKVRREVSEEERAAIERNAATYVGLSQLHRRGES